MAINLELVKEIEDALSERLQAPLAEMGVWLDNSPDKLATVPKIQVAARAFVAYVGSGYGDPKSPESEIEQIRIMRFQVSSYTKDLRTHQQTGRIEQLILGLLTGFQPHRCHRGKLYPTRSQLQAQDANGYWQFDLGFALQVEHTEEWQ